MRSDIKLVDRVTVAAPCPAAWEEMRGTEEKRYCDGCKMHVYNLSAMSRRDAEQLLQTHETRLCIRYGQRPDGRMLTDECPPRLRPVRTLLLKRWAAVASFGLLLCSITSRAVAAMQHRAPARHAGAKQAGRQRTGQKPHQETGGLPHTGTWPVSVRGLLGQRRGLDRSPGAEQSNLDKSHLALGGRGGHEQDDAAMTNKADAYIKTGKLVPEVKPPPASTNGSVFTTGIWNRF